MKAVTQVKVALKQVRWAMRRVDAARRWGSASLKAMPAVIGNSMPKSGSHLIIQILEGLPQIGPFVDPGMPPLNRNQENDILPEKEIVRRIAALKPGDFTYCYLGADEPYRGLLTQDQFAPIFVYRDPRDVIVSHVFYATEMHKTHAMRKYYTETLTSMEERINAAILGVQTPDVTLTCIREKYERYLGWFDCKQVLSIRFEDLILNRTESVERILDHLAAHGFEPQVGRTVAVQTLAGKVQPKKSGTFRKGQPGNWREHFTPANIRLFKEQTGDLLVKLGYETCEDW